MKNKKKIEPDKDGIIWLTSEGAIEVPPPPVARLLAIEEMRVVKQN